MHHTIPFCISDATTPLLVTGQMIKEPVCLQNQKKKKRVTCDLGKDPKHKTFEEVTGIALVHLCMVKSKEKFPLFGESNTENATEQRKMQVLAKGDVGQGETEHKLLKKPSPVAWLLR